MRHVCEAGKTCKCALKILAMCAEGDTAHIAFCRNCWIWKQFKPGILRLLDRSGVTGDMPTWTLIADRSLSISFTAPCLQSYSNRFPGSRISLARLSESDHDWLLFCNAVYLPIEQCEHISLLNCWFSIFSRTQSVLYRRIKIYSLTKQW